MKKKNTLFDNASVILICGPSSAGKSTLASLICDLYPNFLKINTKEISINSETEFSSMHFSKYLDQATKIINRKIYRINEIVTEQKKQNNKSLNDLYHSLILEYQALSREKFFKILYQNYFKEVETILAKGNKCIIDHNIFSDPYPIKKNIFLEFFKDFKNDFKIINVYSNFENILLNTLERNKRFYHFLSNNDSSNESTDQLIESDIKKGFSYYIFRQPLRTMEGLSWLFRIDKNSDGKILQSIPVQDFKKMLTIVKYEQQKLIGFLVMKEYIFNYIEDKELIEFKHDFAYLNEISDNQNIFFIKEKLFSYDFQIITNCNLKEEDTNKFSLNKKILDLRNEINSLELKNKINLLINNIELNKSFFIKNFEIKAINNNLNNYPLYIIYSFSQNNLTIVENIINDITERIGNRVVLYPVAENIFIKMLINNENINFIKIIFYSFEGLNEISKKFEEFDNNLIFLSKLYAGLKLNNKFNNIKFRVVQNSF